MNIFRRLAAWWCMDGWKPRSSGPPYSGVVPECPACATMLPQKTTTVESILLSDGRVVMPCNEGDVAVFWDADGTLTITEDAESSPASAAFPYIPRAR